MYVCTWICIFEPHCRRQKMQSTDFDKNGRMDYRTDSYGSVLLFLCGSGLHMVYPWLGDIRTFGVDSVLHELWLGAIHMVWCIWLGPAFLYAASLHAHLCLHVYAFVTCELSMCFF